MAPNVRGVEPAQDLRLLLAGILLCTFFIPLVSLCVYGYIYTSNVSGNFEDEWVLSRITDIATRSDNFLSLARQILLPLLAILTASSFKRKDTTSLIHVIFLIISFFTMIASIQCAYIFSPLDWDNAAANFNFFSNLASSFAVYVMLLVGLKI